MKSSLQSLLEQIKADFDHDIITVSSLKELDQIRINYLGRKGKIATAMAQLKDLTIEEKRAIGPVSNGIKEHISDKILDMHKRLEREAQDQKEAAFAHFDVTAYKATGAFGSLHPYTQVIRDIELIFTSMGFEIADGPEVETAFVNFEALNIPENHPARDMHDTFWLDVPGMLLRTHTSTVQVHALQKHKFPLAIVAPGRCYRHEATDASHDFMFMQCEGVFIDKKVSLAELFATAQTFLQEIFQKKDLSIRMRPGFFPFVEPGIEIDMTCPFCTSGCSTCKKTGWIEICGSGLIHPNVLKACGIDPKEYSGFGFGFGLTRLVMLKYGINDIRLLHENKLEFLKQFSVPS